MKNIIYSKYTNERNLNFQIRTSIIKNKDGTKTVEKVALNKISILHLENIYKNYKILNKKYCFNEQIKVNKCKINKNKLEFEYIEGISLNEILDKLLLDGRYDLAVLKIKEFIEVIYKTSGKSKKFEKTEKFIEFFGDLNFPNNIESLEVNNIDCIFSNIIINDKWNVIDYEWVFEFPIPIKYCIYRALNNYINTEIGSKLKSIDIYSIFGFNKDELEIYNKMECNFHNKVMINSQFSQGEKYYFENMIEPFQNIIRNRYTQVFYNTGNGFNEKESYYIKEENFIGKNSYFKIKINDNMKGIRIDPVSTNCEIDINKINIIDNFKNKINIKDKVLINSNIKKKDKHIFLHNDPQIYINLEDYNIFNVQYIDIDLIINDIDFNIYNYYVDQQDYIRELNVDIENKQKHINYELEEKNKYNKYIEELENELETKNKHIKEIETSRGYIYLTKIKKLIGK
ncbi:hypothetical protein [Romboutsia lituseburensis]|uniref:hypothetical protein n=1 Tax=Romboutsia lituseburensis TaxID=1537 RepID=UPI00215AA98E|nr:hypothetical protein [Romboutsia lituseburensis]MCR8745454.1 hypothetical protein [Romboutsia lituseburensis]